MPSGVLAADRVGGFSAAGDEGQIPETRGNSAGSEERFAATLLRNYH